MRKTKEVLKGPKVLPSSGRLLLLLLAVLTTLSLVAGQCVTSMPADTEPPPPGTMPSTMGPAEPTETASGIQYVPADWPLVKKYEPFDRLVIATVPWQGKEVLVEKLEPDPELPCNPEYPGDKCNHIVLDFRVVEDLGMGQENPLVTTFTPPITLEVEYEEEDVQAVGEATENLTLRYWDEGEWIAFTRTEHDFRIVGDETGGFGYVNISTWSDRPVCWGEPD